MPVRVEKLGDEPIIIATFEGRMDAELMRSMFHQSAALLKDHQGIVYRITDVTRADADFNELISIVGAALTGLPGTTTDPHIRPVFVGTSVAAQMGINMLKGQQHGAKAIPVFSNYDEALAYVWAQLEQEK